MTVTDMASLDYNAYSLSQNSAVNQYASDTSSVAKQYYNISDISTADSVLDAEKGVSFSSVGNVDSYSSTWFQASQLSNFTSIEQNVADTSECELLSGNTDANNLLSIVNVNTDAIQAYAESVLSSKNPDTGAVNGYESYLQDFSSSNLNMLV